MKIVIFKKNKKKTFLHYFVSEKSKSAGSEFHFFSIKFLNTFFSCPHFLVLK